MFRTRIVGARLSRIVYDRMERYFCVWKPTRVSPYIPQAGLSPGTTYTWVVSCDGGVLSSPTRFITSLWDGFAPSGLWIWAANTSGSQFYAQFRHVLSPALFVTDAVTRSGAVGAIDSDGGGVDTKGEGGPRIKTVATASLFVSAWLEPTMLAAYKVSLVA
jgi:hypothetical protein